MKILGTGLTGLIGSRIVELLSPSYEFESLSRSTGVDITDKESVRTKIISSPIPIVLHLAAKADVDGCEKDKELGEDGEAWKMNVAGTKHVAQACRESGKKMVYVSTDFVFDGEDTPNGGYTEENTPRPVNWYATTKYEGEKVVQEAGIPFLILRLAYPYRQAFAEKNDFVHVILKRLQGGQEITAVTDHIIAPTYVDDLAMCIDVLIHHNTTGIYHTTGDQFISPYDAALFIAKEFGLDASLIKKTTRAEFFRNRAPRPFNLSMNSGKIEKLGIKMRGFEEGLKEIKSQMSKVENAS